MDWSEERHEIAPALAKAQGEIRDALKAAENPMLKNRYVTLEAAIISVRPAFTANGLSVIQSCATDDTGRMIVTTMVLHTSGQYLTTTFDASIIPPGKRTTAVQMEGATYTYARRYALMAVAMIGGEDADGNPDVELERRKSGKTPEVMLGEAITAAGLTTEAVQAFLQSRGKGWPSGADAVKLSEWISGVGAAKIREWMTPKPEPETEAPAVPFGSPEAQRAFFGRMKEHIGPEAPMTYEDVKAWCKAHDKPKPSEMDSKALAAFERWITENDGAERIVTWLAREAGA